MRVGRRGQVNGGHKRQRSVQVHTMNRDELGRPPNLRFKTATENRTKTSRRSWQATHKCVDTRPEASNVVARDENAVP